MIERTKELNITEEQKKKLEKSQERIYSEETFMKETQQLTTKERSVMNLCRLDNYCIFIASRYLDTLDDHLNLIKVTKKLRCNLEKYHYNPISLNRITIEYFPNVETLHTYFKGDEYLEGGRIKQYVDWMKRGWYESQNIKETNNGKNIEMKRILWMRSDTH